MMNQPLRTRLLSVGHLRSFLTVARLLNFRAAAQELSMTQSAVSRQIQALEDEIGAPVFIRHTRAVEITDAGKVLLHAVDTSLERIDAAVRQIRSRFGRKSVALTTWASFASMWLIPRMEAFQQIHQDIDLRIEASDVHVDLPNSDLDVALRFGHQKSVPIDAIRLFDEHLVPVCSPRLLKAKNALRKLEDLAAYPLIEDAKVAALHQEWLSWRGWCARSGLKKLEPKRWIYFDYTYQGTQAAIAGQGIALARRALVADHLASGQLVECLKNHRVNSPLTYWLVQHPRAKLRPEVIAFCQWVQEQAAITRKQIGEEG